MAIVLHSNLFTVSQMNGLKKEIVLEPQGPNLCPPFKSQSLGDNNFVPTLLYFQRRKIGQFVG